MDIQIKEGSIEQAFQIQNNISEFTNSYPIDEYHLRLDKVKHLILIAYYHNDPVGFKVGYAMNKMTFYSWMGGVFTKYRNQGIAKKLADLQEKWAKENGLKVIRFKTRNYLKPMLIFSLKNGFNIVEVINKSEVTENRVILEKKL